MYIATESKARLYLRMVYLLPSFLAHKGTENAEICLFSNREGLGTSL